jgi:arylsulfatase A-like enzyme
VGRVLDYLDRSGLAGNTIVVYTSDQGFFLGEHGLWDKRLMFEESIRMPFLIRYPGRIKAGSVCEDMILNIDFAPTLLDYAGIRIPEGMQGESFRQNLLGQTPGDWRKSMYYQYYEYPGWHMVKRHYGIRTQRYKLIHYYYDIDAWELYDLEKDPAEMVNQYDHPDYADIVRRLKKELFELRAGYGDSDELDRKYLREQPGELLDIPQRVKEYPHLEHLRRKRN